MDKQARAQLLRKRLRAIRGFDLVMPPAQPKPDTAPRKGFFRNFIHLTVNQHAKEMPQAWIATPDPVEPHITLQTSRIARRSALARIADRWDERKLLHAQHVKSEVANTQDHN